MEGDDAGSRLCPVCNGAMAPLGAVDLNRACQDTRGVLSPAGVAIHYFRCGRCGFCNAPQMCAWSLDEFEERIYNADYARFDPDYVERRPRGSVEQLTRMLDRDGPSVRHLDYGGGQGVLSRMLRERGWNSRSYDPFVDRETKVASLGTFDLVTAFEVFEHVPEVGHLMDDIQHLLAPEGVVIFTTLVSDGYLSPTPPLTWWYAAPRNGHISLFSRDSLGLLGRRYGLHFGSFSVDLHAFWRGKPKWAQRFLGASG